MCFHLYACSGGLVGLLLAQGLTKRGIANTVYERDPDQGGRTQGFAITLHWILGAIEQMLPKDLYDQLESVRIVPSRSWSTR